MGNKPYDISASLADNTQKKEMYVCVFPTSHTETLLVKKDQV